MNGPNREPNLQGPERMLGGYATGNLSEQEKQELFSAALGDQKLFDALMDEEALKDLLEQPGAKRELIDALQPKESVLTRLRKWFGTPMAWGVTGAAATAAVVVVMLATRATEPHAAVQVAKQTPTPAPVAVASEAPLPKASRANEMRRDVAVARPARKEADALNRAPKPEAKEEMRAAAAPPRAVLDQALPAPESQVAQDQARQQQVGAIQEQQTQGQDRQQQMPRISGTGPAPPPAAAAPPPPPPAMKAEAPRAPIEYVVMKRNEQGEYAAATAFRDADAVRIRVTAHEAGYVVLTRRGEAKPLVGAQPMQAGQTMVLPPSGFLLPSTEPYRLEFIRQPMVPGSLGVIGGFRAGSVRMKQEELSKSKDAAAGGQTPLVFEIVIKGSGN